MASRYRCKHTVEAMRWMGDGVLLLEKWHREKTGKSARWNGDGLPIVLIGDAWHRMDTGEWLVWSSDEFLVMDDEQFRETYEEG